jgi:hypothetical protein
MFVIGQDKPLFKRELYFDAQFHKLFVTTTFGFFKYFRIKELSIFGFLKKIQNQRIVSSNCFKNLKELLVFMKELSNNWHCLASSSKKKLRTIVIYPNQLFDNFEN